MRMISLILAIINTGCTITPNYGNFTDSLPDNYNQRLVDDTVSQLIDIYPPAKTRLDLQQSTPDAFGSNLAKSLRAKGYALLEHHDSTKEESSRTKKDSTGKGKVSDSITPAFLALRYTLDQPSNLNLYRIELQIGQQSLTRAYIVENQSLSPAGAWSRKE